ncbi:alpha/beta hydrolase, partial [Streptomyces sp. NPDC001999]
MTGTTLTWQVLRDLKPSTLDDAGDGWDEVSGRADSDRATTDRAMTAKLRETQKSESAGAALKRLERLSRNFQYLHTETGLIRTALNGLASELAGPQRQLIQALEDAESLNFTVHVDGSVSYPAAVGETLLGEKEAPGGSARGSALLPLAPPELNEQPGFPGGRFNPNPNAAKAQAIANSIARAVQSAAEIDGRYAKALSKLKAAKGLDVTRATLEDVYRDTAAVRSTADTYLRHGVPQDKSPAEREANRNYLPVLIDTLERQGGADAQTKLEALRGIQTKIHEPSKVPMYLLGIGDEGNGRAIVAYGNPDTSRNVSAYVPGLQTKLNADFVDETLQRGMDTAIGARGYDSSSAAIVWLGYDAPQDVDVMGKGDAERGAPAYNNFMEGLQVTNENKDPHMTAIGHSYGSLTVGTASQQDGGIPGADDVILLGSPGTGVDKAEDLGVGKEHVFVGAAENDPVTKLPSKRQSVAGSLGLLVGGPPAAYVAG